MFLWLPYFLLLLYVSVAALPSHFRYMHTHGPSSCLVCFCAYLSCGCIYTAVMALPSRFQHVHKLCCLFLALCVSVTNSCGFMAACWTAVTTLPSHFRYEHSLRCTTYVESFLPCVFLCPLNLFLWLPFVVLCPACQPPNVTCPQPCCLFSPMCLFTLWCRLPGLACRRPR